MAEITPDTFISVESLAVFNLRYLLRTHYNSSLYKQSSCYNIIPS